MEHKSISGGWEYLPFARARLKAMKAAGLSYGVQRFQVGEVSVCVRLVGGQEYITIDGESFTMKMDSGIVLLGSVIPDIPASYLPGILYETNAVRAYNAAFQKQKPESAYRTNPAKGPSGQLSGIVQIGQSVKGLVPDNAQPAKSFYPSLDDAEPPVVKEDDERVRTKKITVTQCPPSIFTGKTRLYVQAMYGAHLVDEAGKAEGSFPSLYLSPSSTPALIIGDSTGQTVVLNTSSGVYLSKSKRHYLINIGPDNMIRSYEMKASKDGEKARYLLKDGDNALSAQDKERVEAYILSTSRPKIDSVKVLGAATVPAYSMGYGWHWNWSGTAADIVVNNEYQQNSFKGAMRSTHARIQITESNGEIKAKHSIIEGPVTWAVNRQLWCIAEPDWSASCLIKTTPKSSDYFACEAPFYVFYKRDELQVCRVKVDQRKGSDASFSNTPEFLPTNFRTIGERGGYCETMDASPSRAEFSVSVGGIAFAGLPDSEVRSGSRGEITNKSSFIKTFFGNDFSFYGGAPFYETGYPPYGRMTFPEHIKSDSTYFSVGYDCITGSVYEQLFGTSEVVIPLYDSEAIYVSAQKIRYRRITGTKSRYESLGSDLIVGPEILIRDGEKYVSGESPIKYLYADCGPYSEALGSLVSVSYSEPYDDITTSTDPLGATLFCRAGAFPVEFGNSSQFHDNQTEQITAQFVTRVSSGPNPAVIAENRLDPVGVAIEGLDSSPSVFVGWA